MYQRQVSFGEAIQRAFSNYCNFRGRASRSEYWWFCLFNCIIMIPLNIGNTIMSASHVMSSYDPYYGYTSAPEPSLNIFMIIMGLYSLAILLPTLGLCWRRLHDIGKAGGWYFIGLIPFVGAIILIVWFCKESEPTENRFGPVPNLAVQNNQYRPY